MKTAIPRWCATLLVLGTLACEANPAEPPSTSEPDQPSVPPAPRLTRLVVTLDTARIQVGGHARATAEGFAEDGSRVEFERVLWSSSSARVATVDSLGSVVALGEGQADISATVLGVSGAARLTVDPEPLRLWSDPDSWPSGAVPVTGDSVVIGAGTRFLLDVSPPRLATLDIQGELRIEGADEADYLLQAGWIRVAGRWRVGTADRPFVGRLTVVLDGVRGDLGMGMGGNRAIAVTPGGRLELFGESRTSWTHLGASVSAGSRHMEVATDHDWRAGDRIVIAPSGVDPHEAEHRVIHEVSGRTLSLDTPLEYAHFGELQQIGGRTVDQRAEVGLLTRNIRIMGISDDPDGLPFSWSGFGGTLMVMADGWAHIEGVELVNMGQRGEIGRYPMHWHVAGDVWGQRFVNNSIWRSHNRCVTIHATQQAHVEDNVCFDHVGHGFFFEEGSEVGNRLVRNLALLTRQPRSDQMVTAADELPATYWVTNPDNLVRGNVAAGSEGFGFWYALPAEPTGFSVGTPHRPSQTPLWEFRDNTTHSNLRTGFFVGGHGLSDGSVAGDWYRPKRDPMVQWSETRTAVFEGLNSYKNHKWGAWVAGSNMLIRGAILADNEAATLLQAGDAWVDRSLIVGQSDNPIGGFDHYRGFEFYDGPVGVRETTFARFLDDGDMRSSALSFKKHLPEPVRVENAVEDVEFVDARAVWIDDVRSWNQGHRSVVFRDLTSSLTAAGRSWVTADHPFITTAQCEPRPEWNAQMCPGPYVSLNFNAERGMGRMHAERDDGPTLDVEPSNNGRNAQFTLMPGWRYHVDMTHAPGELNLYYHGASANDWVDLVLPYRGDPPSIMNQIGRQRVESVGSRNAFDAANTSVYWYDRTAGRLYLRVHAGPQPNDWAQAHIVLTIDEM